MLFSKTGVKIIVVLWTHAVYPRVYTTNVNQLQYSLLKHKSQLMLSGFSLSLCCKKLACDMD